MSKKKLNLENLKVQSFITSLEKNEKAALKGGALSQPCSASPMACTGLCDLTRGDVCKTD